MAGQAERLAFIGTGLMGLPMAQRLLAAGYEVRVWNRTREKLAPLLAAGAQEAHSAADAATGRDVVLLCVSDGPAVEEVVFGPGGVSEGLRAGALVVDHSSIPPDLTQTLASRLVQQTGAHWVDAPVSGGVPGAENGTLTIMAGGAVEDVERARPALMSFGRRVTHMGPIGAGQTTKLCNQLIVGAALVAMAEATHLAERSGVSADRLAACLAGGFADSIPFQLFQPKMAGRAFEPVLGKSATFLKDVQTVAAAAEACGASLPLNETVAARFRALAGLGHTQDDTSTLILLYDQPEQA